MIDKKEVLEAFKEKFSKMTYEEQEAYLKKMGLAFQKKENKQKSSSRFISLDNSVITSYPKKGALRRVTTRTAMGVTKPHHKVTTS